MTFQPCRPATIKLLPYWGAPFTIPAFIFCKEPAYPSHDSLNNPPLYMLLIILKSTFCCQISETDCILTINPLRQIFRILCLIGMDRFPAQICETR